MYNNTNKFKPLFSSLLQRWSQTDWNIFPPKPFINGRVHCAAFFSLYFWAKSTALTTPSIDQTIDSTSFFLSITLVFHQKTNVSHKTCFRSRLFTVITSSRDLLGFHSHVNFSSHFFRALFDFDTLRGVWLLFVITWLLPWTRFVCIDQSLLLILAKNNCHALWYATMLAKEKELRNENEYNNIVFTKFKSRYLYKII